MTCLRSFLEKFPVILDTRWELQEQHWRTATFLTTKPKLTPESEQSFTVLVKEVPALQPVPQGSLSSRVLWGPEGDKGNDQDL